MLAPGRDDPELAPFHRLCFDRRPAVELYDCIRDPDQVHDLARVPEHADTIAELRRELTERLAAAGDPRFSDVEVRFDDYPYRAGYLQKRIEAFGKRGGR